MNKIGFGGAALSGKGGGYGFGDVHRTLELIHYAIDLGIKTFDTAPIYGFDESEIKLGLAIKSFRSEVKVISKSGITWHDNKRVNLCNDPATTLKMLENSLRNLNTDYIDIFMIHWPDPHVDIRSTMEVLAKAKLQGKILNIGLCNTNDDEIEKAVEVDEVEYIQSECNLFKNDFLTLESVIKKYNIKTIGWGTFDKGILAGSVTSERLFSKSDCRSWAPWWKKSNWKEKVNKISSLMSNYNLSKKNMMELALFYSMSSVELSLCGTKSIEHLDIIKDYLTNPFEFVNKVELIETIKNEFAK